MWVKTEAGRAEMQSRALVQDRSRRNLLVLVDGKKSENTLLDSVTGVTKLDLDALRALGLIEDVATLDTVLARRTSVVADTTPPPVDSNFDNTTLPPTQPPATSTQSGGSLTYREFSDILTKLIASQLGLRGLPLTLAVERCSALEELHGVGRRAIDQVRSRRGDSAARDAEFLLFRQ